MTRAYVMIQVYNAHTYIYGRYIIYGCNKLASLGERSTDGLDKHQAREPIPNINRRQNGHAFDTNYPVRGARVITFSMCGWRDEVMVGFPIPRRICTFFTGHIGLRLPDKERKREKERGQKKMHFLITFMTYTQI